MAQGHSTAILPAGSVQDAAILHYASAVRGVLSDRSTDSLARLKALKRKIGLPEIITDAIEAYIISHAASKPIGLFGIHNADRHVLEMQREAYARVAPVLAKLKQS